MESSHEIVPADQYESSLQVFGESNFLSQKKFEFQAEEKYDLVSDDEASVNEFEEEEEEEDDDDIANKEDYVKTEEISTLEPNTANEKKDELCIGMEFSSDETAYKAYKKFGGEHGFNVRKQRRKKKNNKVVRLLYVCSKEGFRKEPKIKTNYSQPIKRCGCKAHMTCYLQRTGRYKIVSFGKNHNHDLVKTPMKHLLKGNRMFYDAEMSEISAKPN